MRSVSQSAQIALVEAPLVMPGVTLGSLADAVGGPVLAARAPRWWRIGFAGSLLLLLVLVIAVGWLFLRGVGIWGINIPVSWGLAIAEYVWWIALASGGTIISALFYLTRSPWRAATNRVAEAMLLCAAASAGILPIIHLGRPSPFYWLFVYPNKMDLWPQPRSPLWWDFIALSAYVLMSIAFFYTGLLPDLATMRDLAKTRAKQVLYGVLALGWRGSARHWRQHRAVYAIMAGVMTPMVISVHSIVGLDFAGGIAPGWHSTQYPPFFFFGAVTSGTALVILLTVFVRRGYGLYEIITEYHLNALAKVMLVGSLSLGYAYVWEAFGPFYSGDVTELGQFLDRAFGFTAWEYWATIVLNVLMPQLLWLPSVRRSPPALVAICGGVLVGMWLERFVLVVSALHRNETPSAWGDYAPTLWDWATFAGSVGLFLTLFFLMLRLVPIVAMAELREHVGTAVRR
jgi:Ni/Fe-hydrogenase subunit HybB-like protein